MNEVVPIHGRGNFPTLEVVINIIIIFNLLIYIEIMKMVTTYRYYLFQVKLCDLVSLVKTKLEQDGVIVREIRLNGSGASSVIMRMMVMMTMAMMMMMMMRFLPLSPTIFSIDNIIIHSYTHLTASND